MHKQITENSSLLIIGIIFGLLITFISGLPESLVHMLVRENGIIEVLTFVKYSLYCLIFILFKLFSTLSMSMAAGFFVFLLGLRELDFHDRFTTMGIFKTRFYISPEVMLEEKLLVIGLNLALLLYGIYYLKKMILPSFRKALARRRPYSVYIVAGIICMVISKLLDGNSEIFESIFRLETGSLGMFVTIVEECLELFIPVFFIYALLQYRLEHKGRC